MGPVGDALASSLPREGNKPTLLMIGPLPPPYGGVASFVQSVIDQESIRSQFDIKVVRTGGRNGNTPAAVQVLIDMGQFFVFFLKGAYRSADIVHIHTSSYWSFTRNIPYVSVIKNLSRARLVIHVHGGKFKEFYEHSRNPSRVRSMLNSADCIIVTSPSWESVVKDICRSEVKIVSIPNGFNSSLFRPTDKMEARKRLGLPITKKIALTVGYLEEVKGHQFLIEAMKDVVSQRSDVLLYIIGSGSLKKQLINLAAELEISESVSFIEGGKSPEEIALWMSASDLFALPSLNEGSPTVMFESLGCGKPFIGTKVGGIPDIISSEMLGLLCEKADSSGLAQCIISALDRTWDEEYIASYAKQFTWESISAKLSDLYLALPDKKRPA